MVIARCDPCGAAYDDVTFPRLPNARIISDGKLMVEVRTCRCGKEVRAHKSSGLASFIPPADGGPHIHEAQLATMRERGGKWAAYQNHDMGHSELGLLVFLQYGEGRTHATPPERAPDGPHGLGWRYLHVGYVDLASGNVVDEEPG